jgi:hypothetical protein
MFSQSPEIGELFRRIENKKSGYFDMPYKGVDSLWAYAAMIADQYFVIVVPKSEIMTLPEEVGQMFVGYSKKQSRRCMETACQRRLLGKTRSQHER